MAFYSKDHANITTSTLQPWMDNWGRGRLGGSTDLPSELINIKLYPLALFDIIKTTLFVWAGDAGVHGGSSPTAWLCHTTVHELEVTHLF